MKWFRSPEGKYYLLVVPLHGRGNVSGAGEGVNIIAYEFPKDVNGKWSIRTVDKDMHLTHNFQIVESNDKNKNGFYLAGKEGVRFIHTWLNKDGEVSAEKIEGLEFGAGEVRTGKSAFNKNFIVTVEPMHGDKVVEYALEDKTKRIVIDDNLKEGHALAVADFLNIGTDQIIAGWRAPNKDSLTGIKIYLQKDASGSQWESQWVDKNGIACEDIQVMDLNQDGKPDIVASGRSTHNVKVYWNKSK
ncbi:MAG: hypothetical protein ABI760_12365 [Ferruginibacter sp.]